MTHSKFYFYCRRAIFQGILPLLLATITFMDYANGKSHLYLYTTSILFIYGFCKIVLEFIFSIATDNVVLKTAPNANLYTSTHNLMWNINLADDNHHIVVVRKVYKLQYCRSIFFKYIDKLCWVIGMDSPLYIPIEVIAQMTNNYNDCEITRENSTQLLSATLEGIYKYNANSYNFLENNDILLPNDRVSLIKRIPSGLDQSINDIQSNLFTMA